MEQNEDAARRAKALFTAKAELYRFIFVRLIGYGAALEAFFTERGLIGPGSKVLDAGCGTGLLTKIHYRLARRDAFAGVRFFAFDLTPRMLEMFEAWISSHRAQDEIELRELNVLSLDQRPANWSDFDLVLSASMLEYIPRAALPGALRDLIALLKPGGRLVVCITRRDILTGWLVGRWWQSNLYTKAEVREAFDLAGARDIQFHSLPGLYRLLLSSVIIAEFQKTESA